MVSCASLVDNRPDVTHIATRRPHLDTVLHDTHLLGYNAAGVCDALEAEDSLAVDVPHQHPPPLVGEDRVLGRVHRRHLASFFHVVAGERHLIIIIIMVRSLPSKKQGGAQRA